MYDFENYSVGLQPENQLLGSIAQGAISPANKLLSDYNPTAKIQEQTLGSVYSQPNYNQYGYEPQQSTLQQNVNNNTSNNGENSFLKDLLGKKFNPNAGTLGNSMTALNNIGGIAGGLMNLYGAWQSIGLANKKMDMLDQQMRIIGEQWADAKKEKQYIRNARLKIANKFNGVN